MNQLNGNAAPLWQPMAFAAMAGGMGWGIRGQYGHETGAMMAGLLTCLTLAVLIAPQARAWLTARAVAMGAVAMGIGGSMTYGQTVGLSHDPDLAGHSAAYWWGMLGLAIKGSIWIGFCGLFFGAGLGGKRYRPLEMLGLLLAMLAAYSIGLWLFNSPFDPANQKLPYLYFSDHWHWEPDKELKPRFECWGGLISALAVGLAYTAFVKRDGLAPRLGLWGMLGGALGFPIGQSIQAYHAWNREFFRTDAFWADLTPYMNWWNWMETTFGAIMGATLALGLWLNRKRIDLSERENEPSLPGGIEWVLLAIHIPMLAAVEFLAIPHVDYFYDLGLIMVIIPLVAIAGSRWWPYLYIFPIIMMPIAGKTLRQIGYREENSIPLAAEWLIYLILPLAVMIAAAVWFKKQSESGQDGFAFSRQTLLLCGWMYFLINYAFFHFPWPWAEWTSRTPNGICFTICIIGITLAATVFARQRTKES